jgi:dTDP-4-amino-4,6-dideoxygalactose transaminase
MAEQKKEYTKIGYKGHFYDIRFIDGRYFVKGLEGAYTSRARVYEALEAMLEQEHRKDINKRLKELRKEPNSKSKSMKVTAIRHEDEQWQQQDKREIVEVLTEL